MGIIAFIGRGAGRLALAASFAVAVHGAVAATVQVKAGDTTPDAGGCGSKANPCDTIQAGVAAAVAGDVVNVAKGDYPEDVVIETAGIRLRGSGTVLGSGGTTCPGDPTRTTFARCTDLETQVECDSAWHLAGANGNAGPDVPYAASCFWFNGTDCRGCGTSNEIPGTCTNTCTPVLPAALRVAADDVTIEKLRVRGGLYAGISVDEGAENAAIRRVRIEGTGSACIAAKGSGLEVSASTLRACDDNCLAVFAPDGAIEGNRIRGCLGDAIVAVGAGTAITRNTVVGATDHCIDFFGDGVTVERNRVSLCGERGVQGAGSAFSLLRNQTRVTADAIAVDCAEFKTECADAARSRLPGGLGANSCGRVDDQITCEASWELGESGAIACVWDGFCSGCGAEATGCTNTCVAPAAEPCADALVSGNRTSDAFQGQCVDADAVSSGLVVEGTQGIGCSDGGLDLDGAGILARGNSIRDCGSTSLAHGVAARGLGHRVESTTVQGCTGDGFNVSGTDIVLDGNRAIDNAQDGFDVEADAVGAQILRATATNNVKVGIEVSSGATGTTVTNGKASGHLVDFCDEGTGTTEAGGVFGTTSVVCIPDGSAAD